MSCSRTRLFIRLGKVLAVALVLVLATGIAARTRYGAHPDERVHVGGFNYFEQHWWPPDYGSDEVVYSGYGWSRVYTGELVYLIYGKLGHIIQWLGHSEEQSYLAYRMINVVLLGLTLTALFTARPGVIKPSVVGLTLLCVPQVLYVYTYANSNAWGITLSLLLFIMAANMMDQPLAVSFSWRRAVLFGAIAGLLMASKTPYILALVLPLLLLGSRGVQDWRAGSAESQWSSFGKRVLVSALLALTIAAPLRIIYPLTQSRAGHSVEAMREAQAIEGYRPSSPTYPTYRMAAKGVAYRQMLGRQQWMELTAGSFYGCFRNMNVRSPFWLYALVAAGAGITVVWNMVGGWRFWKNYPLALKCGLVASPFILAANVWGSMIHSLHVDFQPQGRYLFASLVPVTFLLAGDMHFIASKSPVWRFRLFLFIVMFALAVYDLLLLVLLNPALR